MGHGRVAFPEMAWVAGAHSLERKKSDPRWPVALLEFGPAFHDPNWCERGHQGLVLEGEFGLEFETGSVRYPVGESFCVERGTRHRAFNPAAVPVRIFVVSSDA